MIQLDFSPRIVFGEGALDYLKQMKDKRIFIVCDSFMVASGMIQSVLTILASNEVVVFDQVIPDPPIDLVVVGMQQMKQFSPHVVIGFGGGSAIDAAKAMKYFAGQLDGDGMEFIAIPTTSGTGSEVTSFAVITDPKKFIKYPLVSPELLPDVALLDTELVLTVPAQVTADTGMDVLTHAIEAYVSVHANDFTDAWAEKAVVMVFSYLLQAYHEGNNREARSKMHHASCLAGMAFDKTSLGLNHAIAHVIGGQFHIPHGRTNSILLPHVIAFNSNFKEFGQQQPGIAAQKYAHLAKICGLGASNTRNGVHNLMQGILKLQKQLKMPSKLSQCGVSVEQLQQKRSHMAQLAMEDGCYQSNPIRASHGDIQEILRKIE